MNHKTISVYGAKILHWVKGHTLRASEIESYDPFYM